MATIVWEYTFPSDAAASTFTVEIPATVDLQNGYAIVFYVSQDGGGTAFSSSGFTVLGTHAASQGARGGFLAKDVTDAGAETRSYTISGANDDWTVTAYVIRGAPTISNWLISLRLDWLSSLADSTIALPTADTTSIGNDSLCLIGITQDSSTAEQRILIQPGVAKQTSDSWISGLAHATGNFVQRTAGTTPAIEFLPQFLTDGGNAWVLAIPNDTGAAVEPSCQDFITVLGWHGAAGRGKEYVEPYTQLNVTQSAIGTSFNLPSGHGLSEGSQLFVQAVTAGASFAAINNIAYVKNLSGDTCNLSIINDSTGALGSTTTIMSASVMCKIDTKFWSVSALCSTIDGDSISTVNRALTLGTTWDGADTIVTADNTNKWEGRGYNIASADCSAAGVLYFRLLTSAAWKTALSPKGACVVLKDGSGNWAAYQFAPRASTNNSQTLDVYIDLNGATKLDESASPLDTSDITGYAVLVRRLAAVTLATFTVRTVMFIKTMGWVGGGSSKPITVGNIGSAFGPYLPGVYGLANDLQAPMRLSVQIGNAGSNDTYFNGALSSLVTNTPYAAAEVTNVRWMVPNGTIEWRVKLGADDTYIAQPAIWATTSEAKFIVDPLSSTSADYRTEGKSLSGATVEYQDACPVDGIAHYGCHQVVCRGAHLNGCRFDGTMESGANSAIATATDGAEFVDTIFVNNSAADYNIEFAGNGPATLDLSGYAGGTPNVKDLRLTGTTGTATITLALGQTQPTYDAPNGITVAWNQPTTNPVAQINGFTALSHIIIHNVTENTIPVDQKINATSYSQEYTEGTTYSIGDTVDVYHVFVSADGTTATKKRKFRAIVGATGWAVSIEEEACTVYAAYYSTYGVTGAAVAATGELVRDGVNLQIDLDDPDDNWYAYRMFMFDKYDVWNNTGNRAWFLNFTAADAGNIDLGTAATLDNLNVNTAKQQDAVNITADGGATIGPVQNPTTGGGGITLFSGGKVLTTSSGGIAPSEAQIKQWVREELATEMARIDVAVSTAATPQEVWEYSTRTLTSGGGGGEADWTAGEREQIRHRLGIDGTATAPTAVPSLALEASVQAVKAKTDNLPSDPADQSAVEAAIAAIPVAPSASVIADAVWDEVLTGGTHNIATSAGRRLRQLADTIIIDGVARGAGTGTNQIQLALDASATNGAYDPGLVCITAGTGAGQSRIILQYDGATRIATVNRDWKIVPDATSEYMIHAYADVGYVNEGLVRAASSNTIQLNTNASTLDDAYNGQLVFIVSGAGADQTGLVIDYVGSTQTATIAGTWASQPNTTSGYIMIPASPVLLGATTHTGAVVPTVTTVTNYTAPDNASIAAIKAKTDNLPADPASQSNLKGADNKDLTQVFNNTPSIDPSSVWNYTTRTLTENDAATLAEIEASTVLAKEATVTALQGADDRDLTEVYDLVLTRAESLPVTPPVLTVVGEDVIEAEDNSSTIVSEDPTAVMTLDELST